MKVYTDEQIEALRESLMCIDVYNATEYDIRLLNRLTKRLTVALTSRLVPTDN